MIDKIKQKEKIKAKIIEKTKPDSILNAVRSAAKIADERRRTMSKYWI